MKDKTVLNKLREYWLNHVPLSVKDGLNIVSRLDKVIDERDQYKQVLDILKSIVTVFPEMPEDISSDGDYITTTIAIPFNKVNLIKEVLEKC